MSRRRVVLFWLLGIVGFCALTMLPVGPRMATYRAADGSVKYFDHVDPDHDFLILNVPRFSDPPMFRIENGRLYLLIQDIRNALMINAMAGSDPRWTAQSLTSFRVAHPELEKYWPKPQQSDAGVVWLGRQY